MKSKVKEFFLYLIIHIILIIPYTLTFFSVDTFAKQDVTSIDSEFKIKDHKSQDFLLAESSDDTEETRLTDFFSFHFDNKINYFSHAFGQNFLHFQKIPYKSLSIPPPTFS